MTERVGQSIVGEAIAAAAGDLAKADGDQLPLFEVPTRAGDGEADALLRARIGAAVARAEGERRGPGRPKGSGNRATVELRQFLLARGRHPLEAMMRWSMHTPDSLALELGCSKLEAFDRLVGLQKELAPYFAAKVQPTDEEGRPVPMMNFVIGGRTVGAGDRPPWEELNGTSIDVAAAPAAASAGMAEIRHSEGPADGQSHGASLTDGAK